MIDVEKMSKEHAELFPKADLASQVRKLEEEMSEFKEAPDYKHQQRERADILIVCAGLKRWCPILAMTIFHDFYNFHEDSSIDAEVERKWNVDQLREWVWDGKTYKHKGKDGNE